MKYLNRANITFVSLALLVVSLFTVEYVKALPTLGMVGLLGVSFVKKPTDFRIDKSKLWLVSYVLVFLFYFVDGIRIDDGVSSSYWLQRLATKVPFLIFPLFVLFGSKLKEEKVFYLYKLYFVLTLLTAIGSLVYYALNYEEVNLLITQSKNLAVVTNHVRYSLLVCFAVFVGFYLFTTKHFNYPRIEKWLYIIGSVVLVVFLHIAAVRSGLVAFYGLSGLVIVYLLFIRSKRYILGGVLLGVMIITPIATYYSVQSVQNKVANMEKDLARFNDPKSADSYSLTGRWFSYKVGYALYEQNKMLGTGIGNFEDSVKKYYEENFPVIERKLKPHNQFLYWLGASGVIGLILLTIGCFYPMFKLKNNQFIQLFVLHNIIVFLSCLVENTFETQLGVNFSVLFSVIPLFLKNVGEE